MITAFNKHKTAELGKKFSIIIRWLLTSPSQRSDTLVSTITPARSDLLHTGNISSQLGLLHLCCNVILMYMPWIVCVKICYYSPPIRALVNGENIQHSRGRIMPKTHEGDLGVTVHEGGKILWLWWCDRTAGLRTVSPVVNSLAVVRLVVDWSFFSSLTRRSGQWNYAKSFFSATGSANKSVAGERPVNGAFSISGQVLKGILSEGQMQWTATLKILHSLQIYPLVRWQPRKPAGIYHERDNIEKCFESGKMSIKIDTVRAHY